MNSYQNMTMQQIEAKQVKIVLWILKHSNSHPRYYEAGKALTEATRELVRKTDITTEGKKTAGLIHFAQNFRDSLIDAVQQELM